VKQIRLALSCVENESKEIDLGLVSLVQEYAKRLCPLYAPSLSMMEGKVMNRYLNVAFHGDLRNEIFKYPELKKAYVEVFMSYFEFKHNVCFKPTWAPDSAPFADVVATFIADLIDKRDGTEPGDVMIYHPES